MENIFKYSLSQTSSDILPQQILKGRDLKDYKIIPDFELKERIVGDEEESAKTNLLEKPLNIENTAIVKSS